jgi:hypothetical protein
VAYPGGIATSRESLAAPKYAAAKRMNCGASFAA